MISFFIKIDLFSFLALTNKKLLGIVRGKKASRLFMHGVMTSFAPLLDSIGYAFRVFFFVRCLFALAVCACDTIASTGSPSQSSELVRFLLLLLLLLFVVFCFVFVDGAGDRKEKNCNSF
jgi:hypothetical protein